MVRRKRVLFTVGELEHDAFVLVDGNGRQRFLEKCRKHAGPGSYKRIPSGIASAVDGGQLLTAIHVDLAFLARYDRHSTVQELRM